MKETEWVKSVVVKLSKSLGRFNNRIIASEGIRLPYSFEILSYKDNNLNMHNQTAYQTDVLIYESLDNDIWIPRMVIEAKINSLTTHDAITYSQKAQTHKQVHPYLRYGILIGNWGESPLPGRLFRHGHHFDFMQSWKTYNPDEKEWTSFFDIIKQEIIASKTLEEILYDSRRKSKQKYTLLHRPLVLGK
jgi:hypothetical protein